LVAKEVSDLKNENEINEVSREMRWLMVRWLIIFLFTTILPSIYVFVGDLICHSIKAIWL